MMLWKQNAIMLIVSEDHQVLFIFSYSWLFTVKIKINVTAIPFLQSRSFTVWFSSLGPKECRRIVLSILATIQNRIKLSFCLLKTDYFYQITNVMANSEDLQDNFKKSGVFILNLITQSITIFFFFLRGFLERKV